MATLLAWLLEEADNEPIEAIVFGRMGWGEYNSDSWPNYAAMPKGEILTLDQAMSWLTQQFDNGFGAPSCPSILAWTKSWVISVSQYDGSTSPFKLPRNPSNIVPDMPGG